MEKKFKSKDFVLLGILLVFYVIINFLVLASTTLVLPLKYIIGQPLTALFSGTIIVFLINKIPKRGVLSIFFLVYVIFFGFMGMYLTSIISIVVGALIGDLIASSSNYQSKLKNALAFSATQIATLLSFFIPIWFFSQNYIEQMRTQVTEKGFPPEYIELALEAAEGWLAVFILAITFVSSIIAIYIGYAILAKHFKNKVN